MLAPPTFVCLSMGEDTVTACCGCAQIRIQLRVPEYGWTTQKVFHLLNFLVAGLRAGVFASWDHVRSQIHRLQCAAIPAPSRSIQAWRCPDVSFSAYKPACLRCCAPTSIVSNGASCGLQCIDQTATAPALLCSTLLRDDRSVGPGAGPWAHCETETAPARCQ